MKAAELPSPADFSRCWDKIKCRNSDLMIRFGFKLKMSKCGFEELLRTIVTLIDITITHFWAHPHFNMLINWFYLSTGRRPHTTELVSFSLDFIDLCKLCKIFTCKVLCKHTDFQCMHYLCTNTEMNQETFHLTGRIK